MGRALVVSDGASLSTVPIPLDICHRFCSSFEFNFFDYPILGKGCP